MPDRVLKDPDAELDYAWDWTAWLDTDETITGQTVTVTGPDTSLAVMTSPAVAQADGVVTAWLTAGTAGAYYRATCQVETSAGRTDERSLTVQVANR